MNTPLTQYETALPDACEHSLILRLPAKDSESRGFESRKDPSCPPRAPPLPGATAHTPHRRYSTLTHEQHRPYPYTTTPTVPLHNTTLTNTLTQHNTLMFDSVIFFFEMAS